MFYPVFAGVSWGRGLRKQAIIFIALVSLTALLAAGRAVGLPIFISIVASGSMSPSIEPLDIVVAVRKGYSLGDVVVWCYTPALCIVHRVVSIDGGIIVTRGDANPVPDPPISSSLVVGVVVFKIPRLIWIPMLLLPLTAYCILYVARKREITDTVKGMAITYTILLAYIIYIAYTYLTTTINPILLTP